MCRILVLILTFGTLLVSSGCNHSRCCRPSNPCHGPYNPYAGNCVNEDIWTNSGAHGYSGCGCHGRQPMSQGDCGCDAPTYQRHSDCGCQAPVSSDCGCGGTISGYPMHGSPEIIYGEPIYDGVPASPSRPPSAPPSSNEYYVPPRSGDFESDEPRESGGHATNLPATLVVPARL